MNLNRSVPIERRLGPCRVQRCNTYSKNIGWVHQTNKNSCNGLSRGKVQSRTRAEPKNGQDNDRPEIAVVLRDRIKDGLEKVPRAPWGVDTVLTVMLVWVVCFWVSAYNVVPQALVFVKQHVFGRALSLSESLALRHLLLDGSQIVCIGILLNRALKQYSPRSLGLFRVQVSSKRAWIAIAMGLVLFPCVDYLHRFIVSLTTHTPLGADGISSAHAKMFGDHGSLARVLWFLVLGVVAPVWEEVIFRGFLLPSLAELFSPIVGICLTALVFSLVHFTTEGFLPLMILGIIFGASYCATANLFPAIMLHSLWNVCLLVQVLS
ncbi:hypothetical protein M9434_001038 [Picochlorum sp. BPE23]|nr:hypothetical protein M9434_001038 [Picochlorum sp. BPE23]